MIAFSINEVARILSCRALIDDNEAVVDQISLDSRSIVNKKTTLFFAIKGPHHDGHNFIAELEGLGVRNFVVQDELKSINSNANFLYVDDTLKALQQFTQHYRRMFNYPVVAITGSNGKTITKEWLSYLLQDHYNVVKSPKSYNSQVGVPLSVLQMSESHNIGIFEAGISTRGEMEHLQKILSPTFGIFCNIGSSHDDGFNSRQEKVKEKLLLFEGCEKIIYCADHKEIAEMIRQQYPGTSLVSWGKVAGSNYQIVHLEKKFRKALAIIKNEIRQYIFEIPFSDDASIENIMHCIVLSLQLEVDYSKLQEQVKMCSPVSMRLELKEGIKGCKIIDDSYNFDLAGLEMALNFQAQQYHFLSKTLIISDILSGAASIEHRYSKACELIKEHQISKLICLGTEFEKYKKNLPANTFFFKSTIDFLNNFDWSTFQQELILVKGARTFKLEDVVNKLQQKFHRTRFEVNLSALTHNLNFYREQLDSQTKIMVMVKAFAYGSGNAEVANLLAFNKVDYLAVAYADEGVELRNKGIQLPIMVMNCTEENFDQLRLYNLEPEIYSFRILNKLVEYAVSTNTFFKVHIKIDTGMHRLGFMPQEIPEVYQNLKVDNIKVASVFSHLAAADETEHDHFTNEQIKQFEKCAMQLELQLGYKVLKHILNSAGIIRFKHAQFDMVRLGIGLYGVGVNTKTQNQLKTVGTLKTIVSQIKQVPQDDTVGYGRRGQITRMSKIATLPIGYADGYDRRFGNGVGKVVINGQLVPTVGNVCMDMIMVDVTNVELSEEDDVIIFGDENPIGLEAQKIGTISYELLTAISERVKRVFYTD